MKVKLHPAAEQDVHEAATFYEREASHAVAGRFISEFKRLVALIMEHPEIGRPRSRNRSGLSMRVFPYTVIYRTSASDVEILVVKHDSRHPEFGGRRV